MLETPTMENIDPAVVDQLDQDIAEEFYVALGIEKHAVLRRAFHPFIRKPTHRFAELVASYDQQLAADGFPATAGALLKRFVQDVRALNVDCIPAEGPVILASNHPGSFDSLSIVSQLPRDDFKVIVSGVPFLMNIPNAREYFIYASEDTHLRMAAARSSLRHLQSGGCVLIFATGLVDPDPAFMPGAEQALDHWSASLGLLLQRVPGTCLVPVIASGVLEPSYYNHPLARLQRGQFGRQKLAEFLMVSQMLRKSISFQVSPRVSFGQPFSPAALPSPATPAELMLEIRHRAHQLFQQHMAHWYPAY
jgi:hypothetical protein